MARWPSLLIAAATLIPPAPLWAEQSSAPPVDLARVIAAMDDCRAAPADARAALRHAREQGFGDLPPEVRARIPVETLVRDGVRLRAEGGIPSMQIAGNCTVYAKVGDGHRIADIAALLASRFGAPGVQDEAGRMSWQVEGRTVTAWLHGDTLDISVGFPELTPEQVAAAQEAQRALQAQALARLSEPAAAAPADEIATAAVACVAALGGSGLDRSEIERAGWTSTSGRAGAFARDGSHVRVFTTALGGGQCIVDAYGADSFDAIVEAVRGRLRARFPSVRAVSSSGRHGDFSRGKGFSIGNRIAVLSSEQRPNGLSVRFTAMSSK